MKKTTIIGLLSGFALIFLAIVFRGGLSSFISFESMLIVLGGVFAATLVNYSVDDLVLAYNNVRDIFTKASSNLIDHLELLSLFSRRARRQGLLTIDEDLQLIEDDYLRNGLELAVDGIPEQNLRNILDDEIQSIERRKHISVRVLESMGIYSPAFGMIGTLIGLILMLKNLDNPAGIGPGLSIALVTTFYGAMLANLVFLPLAGKVKESLKQELNEKQMMRIGILSLADGENPRIMQKKMLTFLNPEDRAIFWRIHSHQGITPSQEEQLYNHWVNQQQEKWNNVLTDLQTGS